MFKKEDCEIFPKCMLKDYINILEVQMWIEHVSDIYKVPVNELKNYSVKVEIKDEIGKRQIHPNLRKSLSFESATIDIEQKVAELSFLATLVVR